MLPSSQMLTGFSGSYSRGSSRPISDALEFIGSIASNRLEIAGVRVPLPHKKQSPTRVVRLERADHRTPC